MICGVLLLVTSCHENTPRQCYVTTWRDSYHGNALCFLIYLITDSPVFVCVWLLRPATNHSRLPGHGGGGPAVWEHCGFGGLLLGGESHAARVRAAVPHGR